MTEHEVLRGRVVTPTAELTDGLVEVSDGVITFAGPVKAWREQRPDHSLPAPMGTLLPGLVDIHCHGGGGYVVTTTDPDEVRKVIHHHALTGTTRLVASLLTAAPDVLLAQVSALAPLVASGELCGLHLEGPFLSHRRCGAQAPEYLIDPDVAVVEKLLAAADGAIKVVTLAPELPGAAEVIGRLRAADVVVALGHSDATYETFRDSLRGLRGAGHVTHLANGMPPLHHRSVGPVGAALVEAAAGQATVELIADGVHIDDGFASLVFAATAPGSVALVTDAMAAAGMPDGDYVLGPLRVLVRDGVARLAGAAADDEPPSIAGGTRHLAEVVARTVRRGGVSLVDATMAASRTPARIIGQEHAFGALVVGSAGDVVVMDDDLAPVRVMRHGAWVT